MEVILKYFIKKYLSAVIDLSVGLFTDEGIIYIYMCEKRKYVGIFWKINL